MSRLKCSFVAFVGVVAFVVITADAYAEECAEPTDVGDQLLDRRYDQVAFVTTHNAMSNRAEGWLGPNQNFGIRRQLDDGVRGLMLDVHDFEGEPYLAHGSPQFGKLPLVDGLRQIGSFLEANPEAIVTIIFECYVPADAVRAVFDETELLPYAHTQEKGEPWPTLRSLVDANRRLVVFTDRGGGTYPWYHDVWNYAVETPFSAAAPEDLKNVTNRGTLENELFILNHFLTRRIGSEKLARHVNLNPFFQSRVDDFQDTFDRIPNFVTVDFYDVGDVHAVVDRLNRRGVPE